MTFSWYAVDRTGQAWVVSFQLNWPHFAVTTAAGWLLSIAQAGVRPDSDRPESNRLERSVQACPRKCITVRLTGAMSMRQNDFGGAFERDQDRGADHRRVRDGDQPGATGGQ